MPVRPRTCSARPAARRLAELEFPEPWASDIAACLELIDHLNAQIAGIEARPSAARAPTIPYVPLLMTVPGIGWILAYTIAAEIGDITRFESPKKLAGYSGLCPRVYQSGEPGPARPAGQATARSICAGRSSKPPSTPPVTPSTVDHYQRTKTRLGRQRGAKVARVEIARKLTEAIWHMLTKGEPFAPAGPTKPLAA